MAEVYWLILAALAALAGMGWFALSLDNHWLQVMTQDAQQMRRRNLGLRMLGASSLVAALLFCLFADHASMAVLVWVMLLAASAVTTAMILTWQPQWLRVLALPWAGRG